MIIINNKTILFTHKCKMWEKIWLKADEWNKNEKNK